MIGAPPPAKGWARDRAERALRDGDGLGAGEALALAAAEQPKDALAAQRAGLHYLSIGRPADAVPWLRRAAQLAPDSREARYTLDRALEERGCPLAPELAAHADLADAVLRIPFLAPLAPQLSAVPLRGGNRNRVFRVWVTGSAWVLRLGRSRTRWQAHWNERANLHAAHAVGVGPEPLFMDMADGTLVTPWLDGPPGPPEFDQPDFLSQAAQLLTRLHAGPAFLGEDDPFVALDWRLDRIAGHDFPGIPDLPGLLEWSAGIRRAFLDGAPPKAPCHNDPVAGNFIRSPDGLIMVDWETAGMADPDWEAGLLLGRIPDRDGLREHFLAALWGDAGHPRAARTRLAEILSRQVEMVEGLQMVLQAPDQAGWDRHARQAASLLRARRDAG